MLTTKNDTDQKREISEKNVIMWQYIMFFAMIILFLPISFLLVNTAQQAKYSALVPCVSLIYIGISSMKNRISIIRLRGQREYSRGTKATVFGLIALVIAIVDIVVVFTPFLSDKFFPF